jgi:hypothetical protein
MPATKTCAGAIVFSTFASHCDSRYRVPAMKTLSCAPPKDHRIVTGVLDVFRTWNPESVTPEGFAIHFS